jgi:hypothetical protein
LTSFDVGLLGHRIPSVCIVGRPNSNNLEAYRLLDSHIIDVVFVIWELGIGSSIVMILDRPIETFDNSVEKIDGC